MSDVIDFNQLKNKVKDKDIDKFEQYVYSLYYSMAEGKMNMMDLMQNIRKYMDDNNISEEKFKNIQQKLIDKYAGQYGLNMDDIKQQMKALGIDESALGLGNASLDYESARKNMSFHEKYKSRIKDKPISTYYIRNKINDLDIILNEEDVIIKSPKKISLEDTELNEFLCSYKKVINDKKIKINICENISTYEY